jgi:hypothetical protein
MKGRNGMGPIIGHLKEDHHLRRNFLRGKKGDKMNAFLSVYGFYLVMVLI